jgi:hypothetical protein
MSEIVQMDGRKRREENGKKAVAAAANVAGSNSGNPIAGVRYVLVGSRNTLSAPRIPFSAFVRIAISILLVSLDFAVAEVIEKRCERGDLVHWPSAGGERGEECRAGIFVLEDRPVRGGGVSEEEEGFLVRLDLFTYAVRDGRPGSNHRQETSFESELRLELT